MYQLAKTAFVHVALKIPVRLGAHEILDRDSLSRNRCTY
jgi:hypothetical protein